MLTVQQAAVGIKGDPFVRQEPSPFADVPRQFRGVGLRKRAVLGVPSVMVAFR